MGSQKQKRKARAIPTDTDNQQSTVSVSSPQVFFKSVDRDGYNGRALTRFHRSGSVGHSRENAGLALAQTEVGSSG